MKCGKFQIVKMGIILGGFVCILMSMIMSNTVHFSSTISADNSTIYNIGDTVRYANDTFTYIGKEGNDLLLLSEGSIGENYTWDNANSTANTYKNTLGNIAKSTVNTTLPSFSNLSQVTVNNAEGNRESLNVSELGSNWWLKDSTDNNRAYYVTSNNRFDGENTISESFLNDDNTCGSNNIKEIGIYPISTETQPEIEIPGTQYLRSAKFTFKMSGRTVNNAHFSTSNCSSGKLSSGKLGNSSSPVFYYSRDGYEGKTSWSGSTAATGAALFLIPSNSSLSSSIGTFNPKRVGDSISVTFSNGQCYRTYENSVDRYVDGKPGGDQVAMKVTGGTNGSATVMTVTKIENAIYANATCPSVTNGAGAASVRPLLRIPESKVLTYNNARTDFAVSTDLTGSMPSSDTSGERPYLTMLTNSISATLRSGADGVTGSTYGIVKPEDTFISLPLSLNGASEGTRYVAGSATDINGNEVYGVLSEVSGTSADVTLNYANLLEEGKTSFKLKLYLIDQGIGDTAYRSEPTEITVQIKDKQEIAFDSENNSASTEYGTDLELKAKLTSDINKQAESNIVFSIPAEARTGYTIISQSYDKTSGIATVKVRPLTGTGTYPIQISKSGDLYYFDAEKKTMNISFTPKPITVHPAIYTGKAVGDQMPSMVSVSDQLVGNDTIPDTILVPYLEKMDASLENRPDVDGIIKYPGTWKLLYPVDAENNLGDFANKYQVTLEDYYDLSDYVFEVDPNGIMDDWILMSPEPNAYGWNNTPVIAKPSNQAKYFGYHQIAKILNGTEDVSGTQIVYDEETKGVMPVIVLKKGTESSNQKTLRRIKLDMTKPILEVSVPSGWQIGSETITINTRDTLSGIDTISVKKNDIDYEVNSIGAGEYECTLTENGWYTVTVTDRAGNVATLKKNINNIDNTTPSITATLGELAEDQLSQGINVTRIAGASGIKRLSVSFMGDGDSEYTELGTLNPYKESFEYLAQMNGTYKFIMETGTGAVYDCEIDVSDIQQNKPVVNLKAVWTSDPTIEYVDGTWTNEEVSIQVRNVNTSFQDPVKYQYKKASDTEWIDIDEQGQVLITLQEGKGWLNEEYVFQAVSLTDEQIVSLPALFTVKIDQTKPATPIIDQEEKLKEDGNFFGSVTLNGMLTPKETKLKQTLYYSLDGNITWSSLGDETSYSFDELGDYQISFKSVDEVGNESDLTEVYDVHVLDKLAQKIVFDTDNPTDATYGGSTITIKAHLDQDVKQQSSKPIVFSIVENDKANILQQSYNSDGTASAVIQILNGDHYVDILIDKAGDDSYKPAVQQTYTLTLHKAPLTITPQIIHGKTIGDLLPNMLSNGTGLVNRDSVPSTLAPHLEAMDGSPATPDANGDGEIDQAGTWKMVYPDDVTSLDPEFAKKYDITAIGYDENTAPQYVFTVTPDGIKDTDLIVTAPTKGDWNNGPVKVELSDHAKANGYTLLEYIKDGVVDQYGADITFHDDHTGFMPTFVVKKNASDTGILKTVRLIRIDQTLPEVTYEIIDGEKWSTQAKQVSVKTSDVTSGMELLEVIDPDGNPITGATTSLFTFMANKNGNYHVLAEDYAGNIEELDILVERIDDVAPTLQAQMQPISESKDYQDIDVTYSIGASGIKEFAVYYKSADENCFPLTPLAQFDGSETAFTYRANQSGDYRFVLINNAGVSVSADVSITDVVQAKPVIALQANLETDAQTPYQSGQWVNEDVRITLSNTNTNMSDPITYQYRKGTDGTWTNLEHDTFLIEEAMWSSNTYEFRGVCKDQVGDAQSILINIDKVRPDKPVIEDSETFDEAVFAIPYTIKGSVSEKESKISQSIYVSSDQGMTWKEMLSNQYVFQQANKYELIFKTIDEAGNESMPTSKLYLTLNDGTPTITIKLNNNPLKDILHNLTFGYLFKERVNVEIDVNWYGMEDGTISYIVDDSDTPSNPTNEDTRWTTGHTFHIDPDQKVMIYAKAINKDGKVARASTGYYVVADQTPPTITFKHDYTSWTNSTALSVEIKDLLTGIKSDQVKVELEKKGNITARYADGILSLSALPEGNYNLSVSAVDGAGNIGTNSTSVKIDVTPPLITGVKDQATYKQYYLPRFVKVSDSLSGLKTAVYQKNQESPIDLSKGEVKIKGEGTYTIQAEDQAGNQISLVFNIVKLPDIDTEIDGTDESRDIIDQIEKEYEEVKDKLDPTEKEDMEDWIHDANEKWENSRVKVVYTEDKKAKVEGTDQVTFDPNTLLIVEAIPEEALPPLPRRAIESYNVYLKKGNSIIQPDGTVKVYLPYSETEEAILYEIDDHDQVVVKDGKKEGEYITFQTDQLLRYAISNLAQKEDPDYKPDPNPDKDPDNKPDPIPDNPKPDPEKPDSDVDIDSDGDGVPDINIDFDCDGKADINIDTNDDGKPDINIDTTGDGKPNYNVDLDGDLKPDLNIGPVNWKTDKCSINECGKKYCTSSYYNPYLNIDTDHDMRPDVNLDIDADGLPELNIDADGDLIPDVNIDSTGDKQANINIDLDGDGIADLNLVRLSKWTPEIDVDKDGFKYDTMTGLKADANIDSDGDGTPDQNIVDNSNNQYILSGKGQIESLPKQADGANTGDQTDWLQWWISFIISACMFVFCMYQRRKRKLTL